MKTHTYQEIESYLLSLADADTAKQSQQFFKTEKGTYGYDDIFLGIRVPTIRKTFKKYKDISLNTVEKLLKSKYHEVRFFAIVALVELFAKKNGTQKESNQEKIYNLYLNNTKYINNWDLVDVSAHHIVGNFLSTKNRQVLYKLSKSNLLWERRIAIVSTFYFIKNNDFKDTLKISELLLADKEDLIHKACGWMLREVGKKDLSVLISFLDKHYHLMPRVMLRYSIEKLEETRRQQYLRKL